MKNGAKWGKGGGEMEREEGGEGERDGMGEREIDRCRQWRMRKGEREMGMRERGGKKAGRQDFNPSWAQPAGSWQERI